MNNEIIIHALCSVLLGRTRTPATLVGVWAVGAEVGFVIGGDIELAVVIVLLTIVGVDGGTLASSAA